MKILPYTESNAQLVQDFIDETIKRIYEGTEIKLTGKAQYELEQLSLRYNITINDLEFAIMNLRVEDYFRGIDPSGSTDYNVCAFCTKLGADNIEVYLKYGL